MADISQLKTEFIAAADLSRGLIVTTLTGYDPSRRKDAYTERLIGTTRQKSRD